MIFLSWSDDSAANEKTVLHIAEETDDDLLASTPSTHTTEDLFTIIHRFERAHISDIQYTIVYTNTWIPFLERLLERLKDAL